MIKEAGTFKTIPQDEESNIAGEETRESESPSTFSRRLVQVSTLCSLLLLVLVVGSAPKGGDAKAAADSTPIAEDESPIQRGQWPPTTVTTDMFDSSHLDTERPALELNSGHHMPPGTYFSIIDMETKSSFELSGMDFSSDTDLKLDVQMSIEENDDDNGYLSVEVMLTRLQMSGDQMGMSLNYDSDSDENNPFLEKGLGDLVGTENIMLVDKDFKIVENDESECDLHSQMQQHDDQPTGLTASDQFESIFRMTQAVPDYSVKAGDEWTFEMDVGIIFQTKAQLLGYVDYDGIDCAVISMTGEFQGSLEDALNVADDEVNNILSSSNILGGTMTSVMFWDNETGLSRWSSVEMDYEINMPNPADELQRVVIPTHQKMSSYTGSK